jgi:hypothetical protein
MITSQYGSPVRKTATGTVKVVEGRLLGFYVAATSSGTIVLRDGGASGTQISGTITPAVGFHQFPADFVTDLHATIGGASIDVTFFVN